MRNVLKFQLYPTVWLKPNIMMFTKRILEEQTNFLFILPLFKQFSHHLETEKTTALFYFIASVLYRCNLSSFHILILTLAFSTSTPNYHLIIIMRERLLLHLTKTSFPHHLYTLFVHRIRSNTKKSLLHSLQTPYDFLCCSMHILFICSI